MERLLQWWHDESQFQVPPMPAHRYVEDNGSAAMLVTKRSAGVTPKVNLGECVTHRSPPSVNKAAHSIFKTQDMSTEVQNRGIRGPTKRTYDFQKFFQKHFFSNKQLDPLWTVKFAANNSQVSL